MPVYEYTALDTQGKKHKGVLDADSMTAARQKIRLDGIYPVEIKETVTKGKTMFFPGAIIKSGEEESIIYKLFVSDQGEYCADATIINGRRKGMQYAHVLQECMIVKREY